LSGKRTVQLYMGLGVPLLAAGLAVLGCKRSPAGSEAQPTGVRSTPAPIPSPLPPALPRAEAADAGAAPSGKALILCANTRGSKVVQRIVLPNGDAFVVARERSHWSASEGNRLPPKVFGKLERAFARHGFFEFPERASSQAVEGQQWDLRLATEVERHQSLNYEHDKREMPAYHAIFSLCERAFADLPLADSDTPSALAIYRTLEDYAKTLPVHDPRRDLLLEWLDSLQADFVSP
jgi:hypothetical protein